MNAWSRSALLSALVIVAGFGVHSSAIGQVGRGLSCFRIAIAGPKGSRVVDTTGGAISATGCHMRTPATSLCLRTASEAGSTGGEVPNWYLCYRVKCSVSSGRPFSMPVADELGIRRIRVQRPQTLCTPVTTSHARVSCPCADETTIAACIPDCLTDFEICNEICADHGGSVGGGSCASRMEEPCEP